MARKIKAQENAQILEQIRQEKPKDTSFLCLHSGANWVSRETLATIEPPEATDTWKPVAHLDFVEILHSSMVRRGYKLQKEQFGITPDGEKLFGVMGFQEETSEYRLSVGFRTSNDKSLAASIVVGCKVFVCDNLCLSGESLLMNRRHSKLFSVKEEIWEATAQVQGKYGELQEKIETLKTRHCNENTAIINVVKAAQRGVMPQRLILPILEEYKEPSHNEFSSPNLWSLHNAFTEVFRREFKPSIFWERSQALGEFFSL